MFTIMFYKIKHLLEMKPIPLKILHSAASYGICLAWAVSIQNALKGLYSPARGATPGHLNLCFFTKNPEGVSFLVRVRNSTLSACKMRYVAGNPLGCTQGYRIAHFQCAWSLHEFFERQESVLLFEPNLNKNTLNRYK